MHPWLAGHLNCYARKNVGSQTENDSVPNFVASAPGQIDIVVQLAQRRKDTAKAQ